MGFLDHLKGPDINRGVEEFMSTAGALLLDVRTPGEYRAGHIPGSQNVPLQDLDEIEWMVENRDTPLFVYCRSGSRSRQAALLLGQLGYTNVKNIGGITAYQGEVA